MNSCTNSVNQPDVLTVLLVCAVAVDNVKMDGCTHSSSRVNCKSFCFVFSVFPFCWLIQFAINPEESFHRAVIFISGECREEHLFCSADDTTFLCLTIVFLFSFLFTRLTVRRHFLFYAFYLHEAIWIYHINDFEEYPRKKICCSVPEREVRDLRFVYFPNT